MKKWKKVLAVGLSAVMTAGIVAGCSMNSKSTESGGNTPEGESAASGDIPTIVWWTIGGTVPSDFDKDMAKINEYLADKLHVKLDLKVSGWGDYENKMNTIINSGENFDIMFVNNKNYSKFVNLGAFENITDTVQSVTPELYKMIPEELWNGVRLGGKVYSVPSYKDSSLTQFWCFDDQYVQKYNIDMSSIKTMEDLDAPFKAMKEGEGKGFYPLQMTQGTPFNGLFNNTYDGLAAGLDPLGVKYDDQSRKVVNILEQPDFVDKLKLLHKWYTEGIINPDANVLTEAPKKLPFVSAQGWPSAVATWQTLNGVQKYDATEVFGPMYSTETIQGSMNAVSGNSKHKEEALKLLQLVNTDQKFRDMLAYGVEGKTFDYVSDGVVKKHTDTWPLAAYTQGTFFDMSVTDDADPDQWNEVKKQNEEAASSTCLGYSLDVTNIQNEMSNCLAVWQKYSNDLQSGAVDPEKVLPQIIKELKSAGFDTVISEAQKQIDEFYK